MVTKCNILRQLDLWRILDINEKSEVFCTPVMCVDFEIQKYWLEAKRQLSFLSFFLLSTDTAEREKCISNDTVVNWQLAAFHIKFHQQVKLDYLYTGKVGGRGLKSRGYGTPGPAARSVQVFEELPVTVTVVGRNNSNFFFKFFFFFKLY